MAKTLLMLVLLSVVSGVRAESVYMVARLNIQGTTYAQVVFFRDDNVNSLERCEREVMYGRNGQWQYYGHLVRRIAGMSIGANYTCRVSPLELPAWHAGNRYDNVYGVDLREGQLRLVSYANYAECVGDFRKRQQPETHEYFCAKANQRVESTPQQP